MSTSSKLLLVLAFLGPGELRAAAFIEPLESVRIISDFGWRASSTGAPGKHDGIDYAASTGTRIRSVESSRITAIDIHPVRGWHVEADSLVNSSRTWRYFHLFNSSGTRSNRSGAFQVIRHNGDYFIVRFLPTNIPDVAYTDQASLHNTTGSISLGQSTHAVTFINQIPAGTFFAPVGRTGRVFGPHLHLEFSDRSYQGSPSKRGASDLFAKNPFMHVPHDASAYTVTIFSPLPGARGQGIFLRPSDVGYDPSTGISTLFNLSAYVNSTAGLNLNRVEFRVAGIIVAGYDYEGALSTRSFATNAVVRPIFDPSLRNQAAGKDMFFAPSLPVPGINLTAGCFILGVHAFSIREEEFSHEVELCPLQGTAPRVRTSTHAATSSYDGAGFIGQVPFSVESDAQIAKVQLFRNSEQGKLLLGNLGVGGTTPDLGDGEYTILAQDIYGRIGGVNFGFHTTTSTLQAALALQGQASSTSFETVGISTSFGPSLSGFVVSIPDAFEGAISTTISLSTGASYSMVFTSTSLPPTPTLSAFITATELISVSSNPLFFDFHSLLQEFVEGSNGDDLTAPSGIELVLEINGIKLGRYRVARDLIHPTISYENETSTMPLVNPLHLKYELKSNSVPICFRNFPPGQDPVTQCNDIHTVTPRIIYDVPSYFDATVVQHVFTPGTEEALGAYNLMPGDVMYEDPLASLEFTSTGTVGRVEIAVPADFDLSSNVIELGGQRYIRIPGALPVGITHTGPGTVASPHSLNLHFNASFITPEQLPAVRVVRGGQIVDAVVSLGNARVELPSGEGDLGAYSFVLADDTPPAAVVPVATAIVEDAIVFEWAASGDDGSFGQAAGYDVRWMNCSGGTAEFTFDTATPLFTGNDSSDEDAGPSPSGEMDGIILGELVPGTTYCMGVKAFDLVGNRSAVSVAMARTAPREVPAVAVSPNLIAGQPELEFEYTVGSDAAVEELDEDSQAVRDYLELITEQLGQNLLSQLYEVGPSGTDHDEPAAIKMRYTAAALANFDPDSLRILESGVGGQIAFPVENQTHDRINRVITGQVRQLNSKFGIFGSASPPPSEITSGGLAISADAAGRLWSISFDTASVFLTRTDAQGTSSSSILLPDARPSFSWSVVFDDVGNPYAIGTASGPYTIGTDLAVYRAAQSGESLVSSHTFDSGFGRNDFIFSAAPPGWIVGAAQTAGPLEGEDPETQFRLALWRFDAATGTVELTTTYARGGGLDVGTGVSVDANGKVWIAGFSTDSQAIGARPVDLALWKYDPSTLNFSGLSLRPGYLHEFDGASVARVLATASDVYVAAPRVHGEDFSKDAAFLRFGHDGTLRHESAWRPESARSAFPTAVLPEPDGKVRVAGGMELGDTFAALWLHESSGMLISASGVDAGAARGAARSGGDLWLAVDNASAPIKVQGDTPISGSAADILPPRTSVAVSGSFFGLNPIYISSGSLVGLSAVDDKFVAGDGLGLVGETRYSLDGSSFALFAASFAVTSEGLHSLRSWSVDTEGNEEAVHNTSLAVDLTVPFAIFRTTGALYELIADDPVSAGVASGVRNIDYLVDIDPETCEDVALDTAAARGTCANLAYAGPFTLSPGTHTVVFRAIDNVGNGVDVIGSSSVVVGAPPASSALTPSTGPVGIPFTIAGPGFGAYAGANTIVLFGGTTAAISVWNDAQIKGTVPGLSSGAYAVTVFRQWPSSVTTRDVGPFVVTRLAPTALSVSSGPIGRPFTLTGPGFGPYAGANTRVLIGGVGTAISVWNDAQIIGVVPGIPAGAVSLVVERAAGSFVASSDPLEFEVTRPSVTAVVPSSGPIGVPFTLNGASFGPYAGSNTRVLFGGTTAAISVWNDSQIKGTVPGISTGAVTLIVERAVGAFVSAAETRTFDVTRPTVATVTPSSGPIGAVFTLSGSSFGPYAGANTRVLIDGATTPISVWNDTQIKGTVPGALSPGVKMLIVERVASNGTSIQSEAVSFQVAGLAPNPISPSSGPIGIPFSIAGMDFGAYAGANTRVLFGGTTAAISVWNDNTINGTVPALSTGAHVVVVERQQGASVSSAFVSTFTLTELIAAVVSPSSAPAGAPFVINGVGFGPYAGNNTRVLIGGATAPISVWSDAQIAGTVPGVPAGAHDLIIERAVGGSVQASTPVVFEVLAPAIASIDPSSGPIGIAFTLAGAGFGPYAGSNTRVLIGGATTPISVWNDAQIKGTVPGALPAGIHAVFVERQTSDGWLSASNTVYFQVTQMAVEGVSPSSGPIGITFTLSGGPFGAYAGANTRVLIGGAAAAISVWNDSTISGTVPALSTGTYELVVEREQGGFIASSTSSFTVADIVIIALTPSSGPIGAPITLTGGSFGAYAGANTRLLIGGSAAAVSVWNDATIQATVPALPEGLHPLWIERQSGSGVQSSATSYFQVLTPAVATLVPSSAPIGAPFTLTGTGFGPYAGSNTRVLVGGIAAPISVWNDSTIKGTVPGALGPGLVELLVERVSGGGLSQSATQAFEVLVPIISTLTPASGPTGTLITLNGSGFGPYAGSVTRLLVGGSTAAVSVWNDAMIRGTVPGNLSDGEYPVVVERAPAGGTVQSASATFTVGSGFGPSALFSAPLSAQPDTNFEGGLALAAADGGRVETPSKAAVEVPPAAMEDDTEITLRRVRDDARRTEAAKAAQVRSAGEPIEFGPEGTRFAVPVVIELPYDPAALGLGVDQTKIAVHYYDPIRKAWDKLLSEVDVARKVVRARTDHFSLYQPMLPGVGPAAAQDEFSLRTAYVFPNPSRNSQAVTFRIQPGLADSVTVRVYDISGRKIHESASFTGPTLFDDGNGLGAQQTYDYAWGVSGVGSGVYIYAIIAKKAGQRDIVTKGKVAVIK